MLPVGEACTSNADCLTDLCINYFNEPYGGPQTCGVFCQIDDDCGSGNICVGVTYLANASAGHCLRKCTMDSQCAPTRFCGLQADDLHKRFALACDGPVGTGAFGDVADASTGCETALGTNTYNGVSYCSKTCQTSSDCLGSPVTLSCQNVTYQSSSNTMDPNYYSGPAVKQCY
jgi:hypothetical protein